MVDNKRIFVKGPLARRVLDACIIHCWSKPLADSGASKVSNGCAGLLVFLCVSSTFYMRWHFTTPVQTGRKPTGQFSWNNFGVHIKKGSIICATMTRACSPRSWCKETPELQPSQKRRWMERKSGRCTGSSTYSFILRRSGFQKTSSASLSSLLYPPDQWIEIPSGLHAVAVLLGHVRYGQGTSRSCMRQGKHGKHHLGTTHGSLAHRIAEGMHIEKSNPTGPISEGP